MKAKPTLLLWMLLLAPFSAPTMVSAAPPPIQEAFGIRYVTGGVGQDERNYLDSVKPQFNLRLMFAIQSGEFLSSVSVLIQDSRGNTVLDALANGPYFFAALPPGSYTVTANVNRRSQQRRVRLAGTRPTSLDFYWR